MISFDPTWPNYSLFLGTTSSSDCLYIDVFQNGIRQTSHEVKAKSDTNPENFENAKPSEVFQRMVSHFWFKTRSWFTTDMISRNFQLACWFFWCCFCFSQINMIGRKFGICYSFDSLFTNQIWNYESEPWQFCWIFYFVGLLVKKFRIHCLGIGYSIWWKIVKHIKGFFFRSEIWWLLHKYKNMNMRVPTLSLHLY